MSRDTSPSRWPVVFWTGGMAWLLAMAFDEAGDVFAGLLAGAALGFAIGQTGRLRRRAEALERRIDALEIERVASAAGAATRAAHPEPATDVPVAKPPAEARPQAPAAAPPVRVAPAAAAPPAPSAARQAPPPPRAPSAPSPIEQAFTLALDWFRRGNPMARAGIVVLFFGAAFLAKYAVEHAMFPIELRLAGLGVGAIVLLGLGWRLRTGRALYAQLLQGGGIAMLYLTIFAASRLYHLLPHGLALALLVVIAVASALLAVAQNALSLAVVGFAGGFLAPVLLSTGGGNHVALFTYYAVLNVGVFTVAWFRAWRVLNLLGFVFTFTITGAWRAGSYRPDQLVSADFFLLLFFLMYVAVSILFSLRQKPDLRGYVSGSLVFGLPVVVFTLHASLVSKLEFGLAWSALAFGVFYLALAFTLFRTRRDSLLLLAEAFAALGVIFASLAVPLAFDRQTTAAMWAVEGAGLLWLGIRQHRRLPRAFGALLQLLAGLGYLSALAGLPAEPAVLNSAFIGTVLLAGSGLLSARWLHGSRERLSTYEADTPTLAAIWGLVWWLYGGLSELNRAIPAQDYGLGLAFAALSALALHALGRQWRWPLLGRFATGILGAAAIAGVLLTLARHPTVELGWLGWPALLASFYALLWLTDRQPDDAPVAALPWLHASAYWLIALLVAWEGAWQIGQQIAGVWRLLPSGLVPALAVLAACGRRPAWPLVRHAPTYRVRAAGPLAAFAALWIVSVNLSGSGDPVEIPYVPLLNPQDLAVAFVVAALARYGLALGADERRAVWPLLPWQFAAVAAGVVFLWLNSALVRGLHHTIDTPISMYGVLRSFAVQASMSIFWSLLGLATLTFASRRAWRALWLVGAALLGVVVLKLFVLDLDGRGTLGRIVSFLSVGAVLLIAGYISPLPPARPAPPGGRPGEPSPEAAAERAP